MERFNESLFHEGHRSEVARVDGVFNTKTAKGTLGFEFLIGWGNLPMLHGDISVHRNKADCSDTH